MKSSIIIIGAFIIGCVASSMGVIPEWITEGGLSVWILYALMLQVGISIGSDEKVKGALSGMSPRVLLLPVATIAGTLAASLLISLVLTRWSAYEVMAVGSGLAYYSLSSILITSLKEATIGAAAAAQLGTIALVSNIFREILTIAFAPKMARLFGPIAPISAGGATSMDITLPVIRKASGNEWVVPAIIHGIITDFSVPLLVPLFCSL